MDKKRLMELAGFDMEAHEAKEKKMFDDTCKQLESFTKFCDVEKNPEKVEDYKKMRALADELCAMTKKHLESYK
jgi:hypothetical protein